MYQNMERTSPFSSRNQITEEYWLYTKQEWAKWTITYPIDQKPKGEDELTFVEAGYHSFGCVPLVPLEVPEGLWVMSKLESMAREHFTKRCALSWSEYKTLLPTLYEFLDPGAYPTLIGPGGEEDRAVNQARHTSAVQERQAGRDKGDRVEWVAPSHLPFAHALDSCNNIRDEMHRVVHQLALSSDTKGKALIRSGESKKVDAAALCIVLEAFGEIGRRFAETVMGFVSQGRGDTNMIWTATGMDDFDSSTASEILGEESVMDTSVIIPSSTFKAIRKFNAAKKLLGDWANEEDLSKIKTEIEDFYSPEGEAADSEVERQIGKLKTGEEKEDRAFDAEDGEDGEDEELIESPGNEQGTVRRIYGDD
jgi:hypothetical protein